MQRIRCSSTVLVLVFGLSFLSTSSSGTPGHDKTSLEPLVTWHGISQDTQALEARPDAAFIADPITWARVWAAWRGDESLPEVDFDQVIILMGTVPGPNRARLEATKAEDGQVVTRVTGTRKGGPGFGYVLSAVPKQGLRAVDGDPIHQAKRTYE